MGKCDSLIKKDIQLNCENPFVKGMEANGVIINRQDIDFTKTVFDDTKKNVIKTLVLKTGKKGFSIHSPGATPYSGAKSALEKKTFRNTFTHDIPLIVLDNGPEVCEGIIDGIANGEFVVILRNKHKGTGGSAEYQIYGYYQGLYPETIDNDKYSEETDGGWACVVKETGSPVSGLFLYDTDAQKSAAAFESMLTAPTA